MDIELFQRAQKVFYEVMELPAAERAAAVQAACGGDAALVELVDELLEEDDAPEPEWQLGVPAEPVTTGLSEGDELDRYIIEAQIGRGGMAEVWRVKHRILESRYALKVLLSTTPLMRQRLIAEGRAQARLVHDNIVPVWDVLDVNGAPGLLMPLISGPSLAALMEAHALSPGDAISLFTAIVEGVAFAHDHGLIHRDLKPANVLLEARNGTVVPRVTDFGLVKGGRRAASIDPGLPESASMLDTRAGVVLGTPAYAAPEQLSDGAAAGAAADVFSLGVIWVELLTGRGLFHGDNLVQLMASRSQPPDLSGLHAPHRALAAAMLQEDPALRPSCAAVRQRLALLHDASISPDLWEAVHGLMGMESGAQRSTHETAVRTQHNISRARDRFIGRIDDLAALEEQLRRGRLVTVTGPGGVGKTRLSQRLGRQLAPAFDGGVWFCDLSDAHAEDGVLTAAGQALKQKLGADPRAATTAAIHKRGRCLLIIDNAEQVRTVVAGLVAHWFQAAPEATFLITSRAPLRIRGESLVALQPLTPDDGVALFCDRAESHGATLTDGQREAVAGLVAKLDGLPLAIELAAARSRMFSPERLAERLDQRFRLLRSRNPELPERHRTLQATLQWSWDLLSAEERTVLAHCSVFAGGFSLDAVAAVLPEGDDDFWVEDVLADLVDHSLLVSRRGRHTGEMRLHMLVSVQAFAHRQLADVAETETRHAVYFAEQALVVRKAFGADGARIRSMLYEELDNFVAATRCAIRQARPLIAVESALAAGFVFRRQGPQLTGIALMQDAAAIDGMPPSHHSRLLRQLGDTLMRAGQTDAARPAMEQAVARARVAADPTTLASALVTLASLETFTQRYPAALALLEEGLRHVERPQTRMAIYTQQAGVCWYLGKLDEAQAHMEASIAIARSLHDSEHIGNSLLNLSLISLKREQYADGMTHVEQALDHARQIQSQHLTAQTIALRGLFRFHLGRLDSAESDLDTALAQAAVLGDRRLQGECLRDIGRVYAATGRHAEARTAWGEALLIADELRDPVNAEFCREKLGLTGE